MMLVDRERYLRTKKKTGDGAVKVAGTTFRFERLDFLDELQRFWYLAQ